MEPIFLGFTSLLFLLILMVLGVHIGIALAAAGLFGLVPMIGFDSAINMTANALYYKISNYSLVVIPLFIFMGLLGSRGGLSKDLYNALAVWNSRWKSGLGIATILGCAGFGAITGSSIVAAAVFGKVAAPEMVRHGYDKKISYGLCAASGTVGMLIPPSILAIVYGILSGESVGKLLIAGIGPGILLTLLLCLQFILLVNLKPGLFNVDFLNKTSWKEKFKVIPALWPVFVTIVVIFGGIYGGIFNPTEAAAVASFTIFVLLIFIHKLELFKYIGNVITESVTTASMIFLILAGASIFSKMLVLSGLSDLFVGFVLSLDISKLMLVFMLSGLFIMLGVFIDSISMIAITIPFITPVVETAGINPYYFAMVVITATQVGIITPPLGLAVYTVKSVASEDVTLGDIFMGSLYFLFVLLIGLILIILFPVISTIFIS